MKRVLLIIYSAILVWLVTSCAGRDSLTYAEKDQALRDYITGNELNKVDKVSSFKFYGWNSLSNDFIILSSSPKRRFLVELSGFCQDIPWAHTIIVNRGQSNMLYARFDSVSASHSPEMKCTVKTIYPITPAQFSDIQHINKPVEQ